MTQTTAERKAKARYYKRNKQKVIERSASWRKANPERFAASHKKCMQRVPSRSRKYTLKRKYGVTIEQYDATVQLQNNACAVCLRTPPEVVLCIDHDHVTKRVRGLLCRWCNHKRVGRDTERHAAYHRRIADYLESTFDMRTL